jgi:hypothetical protein
MAAFHPTGRQILTGGNDGAARLWALAHPQVLSTEEVVLQAEVQSGLTLDENDVCSVLDAEGWESRRHRLNQLTHSSFNR